MLNANWMLRWMLPGLLAGSLLLGAPKCGDVIALGGGTLTLTANVGTCATDGLVITGAGTVDLNGFAINGVAGSAGASGAGLRLLNSGKIVIRGPGRIVNFKSGVAVPPDTTGVVIEGVTFVNDVNGVNVDRATDVHIRNNFFRAGTVGNNATFGVFVTSSNGVKIKANDITGQCKTGIVVNNSLGVTVTGNNVVSNSNGLEASGLSLNLKVIGNTIARNFGNGVWIQGGLSTPDAVVLEGNDFSDNTRDGMALAGSPSSAHRAEDNFIQRVGRYGANVDYGWKILDNEVYRSSVTDLYWTGAAGTCFKNNQYGTSNPSGLQPCL